MLKLYIANAISFLYCNIYYFIETLYITIAYGVLSFDSAFPLSCFYQTIKPMQSIFCLRSLNKEYIKQLKITFPALCLQSSNGGHIHKYRSETFKLHKYSSESTQRELSNEYQHDKV